MAFSLRLHDAVAKLAPLEFGFAGGRIVSDITIDARQEQALRLALSTEFRKVQVAKLFPTIPQAAKGVGTVQAQIRLQGTGNSIADAAAVANGQVGASMSRGRLSNLLDAIAGLNGGKILALLVGGDKQIAINCGRMAFRVADGVGRSELFVVDTEQSRIDGSGSFSLKEEQINITVEPMPKQAGILSLRTPLHVRGSFRNPEVELDKGPLLARAGGAVLLALINPLAALIPLIETGPGTDTDCTRRSASAPVSNAPAAPARKAAPQAPERTREK